MQQAMLRRALLSFAPCVAAAGPALVAGCAGRGAGGAQRGDALVRRPARHLALTLADLPGGFRFGEELAPVLPDAGAGDPWGRLSAYSVTFVRASSLPPEPLGDVVSSVNAYSGVDAARSAFGSWRDAVPRTYRISDRKVERLEEDSVVYVRDTECLAGFRVKNVIASVWVGSPRPPEASAGAGARAGAHEDPAGAAVRLAGLVARRIEAQASR